MYQAPDSSEREASVASHRFFRSESHLLILLPELVVMFYFYIYPEVRFLAVRFLQVCRHRGRSGMSQGGAARVNQLPVSLGPDILPGLVAVGSGGFYLIKTNMQEG